MVSTLDSSIGLAQETTYGTFVTPSRFLEFTSETLDLKKTVKQGADLRVGRRVGLAARRVIPQYSVEGDITVDCLSKGQGMLWQAALGGGASTMVIAGCYQKVFGFGDLLPSFTIQKGLPSVTKAGVASVQAWSATGAQVNAFTFTQKAADIATLKVTWQAQKIVDTQAYAAPSYAVGGSVWSFEKAEIFSGTYVPPTATALASGSTPLAQIRDFELDVKNNLSDRYNIGKGGYRDFSTLGSRAITGKMTAEYFDNSLPEAILDDAPLSLLLTYTGAPLGANSEALQICVPSVRCETELPKSNAGEIILNQMAFTALDDLTNPPLQVVQRTAEEAI